MSFCFPWASLIFWLNYIKEPFVIIFEIEVTVLLGSRKTENVKSQYTKKKRRKTQIIHLYVLIISDVKPYKPC